MRLTILLYFTIFFSGNFVFGQDGIANDHLHISILTCRSGDQLYSTFGHSALRIVNDEDGTDLVFNYGTFNMNAPFFYIKFLRGQLPYKLSVTTYPYFLREYRYFKRSVLEQKLNLSPQQKQEILEYIKENLKPENVEYPYDFFFDNCSTRLIDVIESLQGELVFKRSPAITFRQMLKENLSSMPWSEFGIDLVIGARADQHASVREQNFLPENLMMNIDSAELVVDSFSQDIASKPILVLDYERENIFRSKRGINMPLVVFWLIFVFYGISLYLFPSTIAKVHKPILSLYAILGLFLAFMWWGTNHLATKSNWNLLWLNPFLLSFLNSKLRKYMFYPIALMLALSMVNGVVQVLPMYFHPAFTPLSGIALIAWIKN